MFDLLHGLIDGLLFSEFVARSPVTPGMPSGLEREGQIHLLLFHHQIWPNVSEKEGGRLGYELPLPRCMSSRPNGQAQGTAVSTLEGNQRPPVNLTNGDGQVVIDPPALAQLPHSDGSLSVEESGRPSYVHGKSTMNLRTQSGIMR
jgi:hypothetical protein